MWTEGLDPQKQGFKHCADATQLADCEKVHQRQGVQVLLIKWTVSACTSYVYLTSARKHSNDWPTVLTQYFWYKLRFALMTSEMRETTANIF